MAALECGKNYPALFVACEEMLYQAQAYEKCEKVAAEALGKLDKTLCYRGKAAALGTKAAQELGHMRNVRKFREEAFWSEPSVCNLLSLLNCVGDSGEYHALLEKERIHLENIKERSGYAASPKQQYDHNALSIAEKEAVGLFLQNSWESIDSYAKQGSYLGWSDSSEGVIVPLVLACMAGSRSMSKAMRAVVSRISDRCGLLKRPEGLWELLSVWRARISEAEAKTCMKWLAREIVKRTETVVGGGFRGSYVKAAELVVALDEVYAEKGQRRLGETREQIRKLYSRKSAFKGELEELARG